LPDNVAAFYHSTVDEDIRKDIRNGYGCAVVQLNGYSPIPEFLFKVRQMCADS
jgi:hypothetical protein